MCGIAGFIAYDRDNSTPERALIARDMAETLTHRGPDDTGCWAAPEGALAHRRLAVMDPARGRQPMFRRKNEHLFAIVYNGEVYNAPALRRELEALGRRFETTCDTEVVLAAYMEWREESFARLEGIYAFCVWDGERKRYVFCRDRFGVKPLFYAAAPDGALVFASELKALFCYPGLDPRIDANGWREVLGIGPARTSGVGVFAGVKELRPGRYMTVDRDNIEIHQYWQLTSQPHTDDYAATVERTRELLRGAIERQLQSDVPLCTFLSGGLDSSVITAAAALYYRANGRPPLETYSFDYTDNKKYFRPSSFQPDADWPWVERMSSHFGTNHRVLTCPIPDLVDALTRAAEAKDLPGMADVDASLWWYCREVAKRHVVALSGECADEVFGGYPWFERPDMLNAPTFPWCPDLSVRRSALNKAVWDSLSVEDYVQARYEESLAECPRLDGETGEAARRREVAWLNLNWFMATLLDRKDRMSMASGLEVRVPFCDHHLVEYIWNVPWEMKARGGMRKQLLRDAAEGLLPDDVRARPKSPFPKTHNPLYEQLVREKLTAILDDPSSPVRDLVDEAELRRGLLLSAGDYGKPWFGQLMAGPQMIAYLIQIDGWMRRFGVQV